MRGLNFDIAHMLASAMVAVSFLLLYQNRVLGLVRIFTLHSVVLAASVGWQGYLQGASHLYISAGFAFAFKAVVVPVVLYRTMKRLRLHRAPEILGALGPTMLGGLGLVALSILVMLPLTTGGDPLMREDLAFALSVIMLGMMAMIARRSAPGQFIGYMSLENGLILAAAGARGMPWVVEVSMAFSVLVAILVFTFFLRRMGDIGEKTALDVHSLHRFRGDAP